MASSPAGQPAACWLPAGRQQDGRQPGHKVFTVFPLKGGAWNRKKPARFARQGYVPRKPIFLLGFELSRPNSILLGPRLLIRFWTCETGRIRNPVFLLGAAYYMAFQQKVFAEKVFFEIGQVDCLKKAFRPFRAISAEFGPFWHPKSPKSFQIAGVPAAARIGW